MILILLLGCLSSFLITFLVTPFLTGLLKEHGVVGKDIHKVSKSLCAEMGGVAVLLGFSSGFFIILLLAPHMSGSLVYAFLTIVLIGCIGVVDDLFTLRQRYKPFLVALASFPLVFISFGRQELWFPLVGLIFIGPFYLILVSLGVATASNMTNMLAGFNGLESGIGAISCFALGVACAFSGRLDACSIAFPLSAAFLAFLRYNWYPAKVFPGDTGTLVSGAAVATISVFGGVEFAGIFMIAPCAIDFALKMISRRPFSQRRLLGNTRITDSNVLIAPPYPALPHAFLRIARLKERELVSWLLFMQGVYSVISVFITILLK
jgi:UDP-N-acetylglucosamine--dolichyl-phosphate N-acetylglucosaminephosphotransferase